MTGVQTLEARLALGCVAGIAAIALSSLPAIHRPTFNTFRAWISGAFLASRLLLFGAVFLLFKIAPRGDIPAYYFREGAAALGGSLPYRDFLSSYAPLHSYVDAAVLLLWHSPVALILFAILAEFLLFCLWLHVGQALFPDRDLRIAAVLYLASAMSLQFVAIDGQDNVLIALFLLLALWMAMRSRAVLSGILAAFAAVSVKLIPMIYAPVFFVTMRRRWAWALGFAATVLVGYGAFAALGLPVLQPLAVEGALRSSGNIPFVVGALLGRSLPMQAWDALLLLLLGGVYGATWKYGVPSRQNASANTRSRTLAIVWALASTTLVLVIFANKSWPPYLMLTLFPLCAMAAGRGASGRVLLALFGIVALVEKSYWATLLSEISAVRLHIELLGREPKYLLFLGLEALLLAGYGWLLKGCLARLREAGREQAPVEQSEAAT